MTRLWSVLIFLACAVSGCASPAQNFADQASELGLSRAVITGTRFDHVVYRKSGTPARTLHLYLDGDGTPWVSGRPADDPTARNTLVLRLIALDPAPAIYLGRPCYQGLSQVKPCASHYWQQDRYSEEVVDSLAAAADKLVSEGGYDSIAWFGHSGGGTLAVLLGPRFHQTTVIVTVAANLDTRAWSAYAGRENMLDGSLNPAEMSPPSPMIRQLHFAGGSDHVVPPELTADAATHLGSQLTIIKGFSHNCCWERAWPAILGEVEKGGSESSRPGNYQSFLTPRLPP